MMRDSIGFIETEIVVPSHEENLLPLGMQKAAPKKSVQFRQPIATPLDSAAKAREDSIIRAVNDSLARQTSGYGLVLEAPYKEMQSVKDAVPRSADGGLSWIFAVLAILFCVICMKLKNSSRYIRTLITNLRDVRTRHNLFDNTVRETSFLVILIIGWICSSGILLWTLLQYTVGMNLTGSLSIPDRPLPGIGICCGVSVVYVIFMLLAYEVSGNIFTDSKLTRIWVKGATACMGLETFLFFPLSLLALCYPEWDKWILLAAGIVFALGKLQFIYKGFRIFFTQISSLLLFLYYLCSIEIVPLILAYFVALKICVTLL